MTLVSCGPTSTTAPSSSATPTVTPTTATTSTPAPTTSSETPTTSSSETPTTSEETSSSETSSETSTEESSSTTPADVLATGAKASIAEGYTGEIRPGTGAALVDVAPAKAGTLIPLDATVATNTLSGVASLYTKSLTSNFNNFLGNFKDDATKTLYTTLEKAALLSGYRDDENADGTSRNGYFAYQYLASAINLDVADTGETAVGNWSVSYQDGKIAVTAGDKASGILFVGLTVGGQVAQWAPVVAHKTIYARSLSKLALASGSVSGDDYLVKSNLRKVNDADVTTDGIKKDENGEPVKDKEGNIEHVGGIDAWANYLSAATVTASIVPGDPALYPVNATSLYDGFSYDDSVKGTPLDQARASFSDEYGLDWSSDDTALLDEAGTKDAHKNAQVKVFAGNDAAKKTTITATYYIPDANGDPQVAATASASFDVVNGILNGVPQKNEIRGQKALFTVNGEWQMGTYYVTSADNTLTHGDWIASGTLSTRSNSNIYNQGGEYENIYEDADKAVSRGDLDSNVDFLSFTFNRGGQKRDNEITVGLGDSFIGGDEELGKNDERKIIWKTYTIPADPTPKNENAAEANDNKYTLKVNASDFGFDAKDDITFFSVQMDGRGELGLSKLFINLVD